MLARVGVTDRCAASRAGSASRAGGGEKTVFEGVRVTDRCAGRCSPVHPATAVRHRG